MGDVHIKYKSDDGSKDVAVPGTAEPISTSHRLCKRIVVQGKPGNADEVYVGSENVDSTNGVTLLNYQSEEFLNRRLDSIYVDAKEADDGVTFHYEY